MSQEEQLSAVDLALVQLGRRLQADGYRFITPTPLTHQRVNTRAEARRAETLRDVFLAGRGHLNQGCCRRMNNANCNRRRCWRSATDG